METTINESLVNPSSNGTVLLIDDDQDVREGLSSILLALGYQIKAFAQPLEFFRAIPDLQHAVLIVDMNLPQMSGTDIQNQLLAMGSKIPIIFITGDCSLTQGVQALKNGAIDFLIKPFQVSDLVKAIQNGFAQYQLQAELELTKAEKYQLDNGDREISFADLTINKDTMEVTRSGVQIVLTPKEFTLLSALMEATGRVLSRNEIIESVWGEEVNPVTNVVDVYVNQLRRKIDQDFDKKIIKTVRGFGYKLVHS